jgi:hypothetical protein
LIKALDVAETDAQSTSAVAVIRAAILTGHDLGITNASLAERREEMVCTYLTRRPAFQELIWLQLAARWRGVDARGRIRPRP